MFLVAGMICILTFTGLYIRGTIFFIQNLAKVLALVQVLYSIKVMLQSPKR